MAGEMDVGFFFSVIEFQPVLSELGCNRHLLESASTISADKSSSCIGMRAFGGFVLYIWLTQHNQHIYR